jgi:organic hydroperoxide reductase OsmC/OhrA
VRTARVDSRNVPQKAQRLEFDVAVAADRSVTSGLGSTPIPAADEWQAEHLVLAGLVRCTLASLDYHVRKHDLRATASGSAHGVVTKREEDGLYGFVEIDAELVVDFEPPVGHGVVHELIASAERGCFVGNSLTARPRYRWIVNGENVR